MSSVVLLANVALAAVAFGDQHASITLDYVSVSAVYWPLLSPFLGAPSIVLAIREWSTGID